LAARYAASSSSAASPAHRAPFFPRWWRRRPAPHACCCNSSFLRGLRTPPLSIPAIPCDSRSTRVRATESLLGKLPHPQGREASCQQQRLRRAASSVGHPPPPHRLPRGPATAAPSATAAMLPANPRPRSPARRPQCGKTLVRLPAPVPRFVQQYFTPVFIRGSSFCLPLRPHRPLLYQRMHRMDDPFQPHTTRAGTPPTHPVSRSYPSTWPISNMHCKRGSAAGTCHARSSDNGRLQ